MGLFIWLTLPSLGKRPCEEVPDAGWRGLAEERFLLTYQIPLEKLIRYELACRGYDAKTKWVGFDKAKQVWLK